MAALCLTTSSLSFNSAPQNMMINIGKVKPKVKYVKQKNFTFILMHLTPYPCTFPHIPRLLTPYPCTFPHIPRLLTPYPCTFPHIPRLLTLYLCTLPHIPVPCDAYVS